MKLATFTSQRAIFFAKNLLGKQCQPAQMLSFDFSEATLTAPNSSNSDVSLCEFANVFTCRLGKMNLVKHAIHTEGAPFWQPIQRLPVSTKGVVWTNHGENIVIEFTPDISGYVRTIPYLVLGWLPLINLFMYINQHECSILHFTIGSSLVSNFTHWLGIHWSIALEIAIGYFYPLETHVGYSHWILLYWNHHHWNNSHTETSIVSHWIKHSLTCIIGHWLKLTLNRVYEIN